MIKCVNLSGIPLSVQTEQGIVIRIEFAESCEKEDKSLGSALVKFWKTGKGPVNFTLDVNSTFKLIYNTAMKIPFGKVISYGGLSERVFGTKKYARYIGYAMKKNPLPVIVPCHRVVRSDGAVGGFGAGSELKKKLLLLEGIKFKNGKIPKSYFAHI